MDGFEIIIDDREKAIIPHFETLNKCLPYKVDRILTGDYCIMYRGHIIFALERKTWTDLAASIKDGRSKNVQNLIDLREKTQCKLIYIMEGQAYPNPDVKFARIPCSSLQSHLDHIMIRDNIHIIYAKNQHETAYRINQLALNYSTIDPSPLKQIDESIAAATVENDIQGSSETSECKTNEEHLLKIKKEITPNMILHNMWCVMPCVNTMSAVLMMDNFAIKDYILGNVKKDDIAILRYNSGSIIGELKARRMLKIIGTEDNENKHYYVNMLAEIPQISKASALKILKAYQITNILNGTVTKAQIRDIPISAKKKMGIQKANNIFTYLGL